MRKLSLVVGVLMVIVPLRSVLAQESAAPSEPQEAAPAAAPGEAPCPALSPAPATEPGAAPAVIPCPVPAPAAEPGVVVAPEPAPAPLPMPSVEMPIDLDQALEIAFRYNPSLRVAVDQIQRARATVAETRANFNPSFSATVVHLRQNETVATIPAAPGIPAQSFTVRSAQDTTGTANALLPLDINHSLGYTNDIAKLQFQVEYWNLVTSAEQLILDVKTAYYDLLRACGQRDVAQAAVEVAQVRLNNTRARFEAGTVSRFDVTSAEVDVANLNQQLIQAESQVLIAQSVLNRVLGVSSYTPTTVVGVPIEVVQTTVDVPECVDLAMDRRPELRSGRTAVLLNDKSVKLQRSGYLPSANVTGTFGYTFVTTGLNTQNANWQVALNLNIPIWNGGITKARVNQARADRERARDVLDQNELGVALDVRTAALSLEEAAKRVATTEQNVALAEEALRLANVRYEAGIAILVEVTNAESQLTQARFNNVNARYDYAVAAAELQRATSTQPEIAKVQLLEAAPQL